MNFIWFLLILKKCLVLLRMWMFVVIFIRKIDPYSVMA